MNRFIQRRHALGSLLSLLSFWGLLTNISAAGTENSLANLSLTKNDRILILAPHPDDEVIGCGGIIQAATKTGAEIKVLYLTEGEHNPISLVTYKKRLFFKDKQQAFIKLGKVRKQESTEALGTLGIDETRLIFLDYPDSGIMPIFVEHWGRGNEYQDSLTGLYQAAEGEGVIPNSPYTGEAILNEIENVLRDFKPTKIFCSHPLDQHGDHIGMYLFLKIALWDLGKEIPKPEIYLYLVHYRRWPSPRGFHPDKRLFPPEQLGALNLSWFTFPLNSAQIERKRLAVMKFQSQIRYSRDYLLSFVRSNEIFSEDFKEIPLGVGLNYTLKGEGKIKNISFRSEDSRLTVEIRFVKRRSKTGTIRATLYLFGYQKEKAFKDMPKIKIGFRSNKGYVYNQGRIIRRTGIAFAFKPNGVNFRIPLALLGNPDFILSSLRSGLSGAQIDRWSSWRVINLTAGRDQLD